MRTGSARRVSLLALGVLATSLACGLAVSVPTAPPARAHATLVKTKPKQDATLTKPRNTVKLTFDEAIQTNFAKVRVTGPDDTRVDQGKPHVVDATVTQPVNGLPTTGTYTVAWRVVSADGHPVEGSFAFTVGKGAVHSATPRSEAAATHTAAQAKTGEEDPSFLARHWLHMVGVLVLVAIGIAVVSWERRRRHG